MGCEGLECPHRNALWFPSISLSSSTPLSLLPLQQGCSVGTMLNTPPRSEGVQGWGLVLPSSPGSDAELPPAGPGPACPSPVETFPVGMPGPWPGCQEPFTGYLQSIISRVITSLDRAAGQIQAGLLLPLRCCWGGVGTGAGALEPGWLAWLSFIWICSPGSCCSPTGAGLPLGTHATPPHGQEPLGLCSPTMCLLLSASSPAAFLLRNQFLLLTAVLRKPSKTAKHGMQNKIQSEGLNYSRIENTQLIKSARHWPSLCAGPKAPLCLRVLLCCGPGWA